MKRCQSPSAHMLVPGSPSNFMLSFTRTQTGFSAKFGDLRTSEQLDQLTAETRRYMLRRMKEDVEKSVPPKEETHVSVELTGIRAGG